MKYQYSKGTKTRKSPEGKTKVIRIMGRGLGGLARIFQVALRVLSTLLVTLVHKARQFSKYAKTKHHISYQFQLVCLAIVISLACLAGRSAYTKKYNRNPAPEFVRLYGSAFAYEAEIPTVKMKASLGSSEKDATIQITRGSSVLKLNEQISEPTLISQKNQATYSTKDKNIELQYQLTGTGIKENIVIKKPTTSTRFVSTMTLKDLVINRSAEGMPVFTNKKGEYQFHFERPFAEDASGNRTYAVSYKITPTRDVPSPLPESLRGSKKTNQLFGINNEQLTESTYTLVTEIDPSWILDPKRVYPIMIDPTITHNTSSTFATGELNRVFDAGSGSNPSLQTYYQELHGYTGIWHLNETADDSCDGGEDACDSSGNNLDGTATGTTINTTTQKLGAAARTFNGTSDFITVADNNNLSFDDNTMSAEAWVKRSGNPGVAEYVLLKGAASNWEYAIIITTGGLAQCQMWIASGASSVAQAISTSSVTDGDWHHIACVSNGNMFTVYVDGRIDNISTTFANAMTNGTAALTIGDRADVANSEFQGDIDEIRLSPIARSAEEIKLSAQRRPYGIYTSPVVDLGAPFVQSFSNLSWDERGVLTGDGETASSSTGLIAQWNLNSTSGTTATNDAGGGTCGGTATDCDTTLASFSNTTGQDVAIVSGWTANNRRWGAGALMFDGTDDLAGCTDANCGSTTKLDFTASQDFTLESWFKTSSVGTTKIIMSKRSSTAVTNAGYTVFFDTNDLINCRIGDGTNTALETSIKTYADGDWHHVACVIDRTAETMTIYVDGAVAGGAAVSTSAVSSTLDNTQDFRIGALSGTLSSFHGTIDAVRIYRRALPAHEILSNYNAANLEMQTRVGSDTTPEDGGWEEWRPTTSETQIFSFDNVQGIATPSSNIWPTVPIATSSSTIIKMEGNGALKTQTGHLQVESSVVGLWKLDETGGSGAFLKDISGYGHDGTPTGSSLTNGLVGKARSFNGTSSDYVTIASTATLQLSTNYTFEAWIRRNADSGGIERIISKSDATSFDYWMQISATDLLNCGVSKADASTYFRDSAATIPIGVWTHVACTFNSAAGLNMYVNGVLSNGAATGVVGAARQTTRDLNFARLGSGGSFLYGFNAYLDEVRISNRVRTASEIAESHRMGRDHRFTTTLSSTDLSGKKTLPFWIAANRPGTYLTVTAGEGAFANSEPDASTVALWHLEENSGNGAYIRDATGNGNHGTPTAATNVQGQIGAGKNFNGSTSTISIPSNAAFDNANITISAWVRPEATTANISAFARDNNAGGTRNWMLGNGTTVGTFRISIFIGNTQINAEGPTTMYSVGDWHHIAGTHDGTTLRLYVDGVLAASTAAVGTIDTDAAAVTIGSRVGTAFWDGQVDEARIDSVARTQEELRQAYEVGRRTHPITVDFSASLGSTNLIGSSGDLSFTVNATTSGAFKNAEYLFPGDKIVVSENYNGTEYIAQGSVNTVDHDTGATTVISWDSGSTFPAGGYSPNAVVFKWQREYWDITGPMDGQIDAVTNLTFKLTAGDEGRVIYVDDLKSAVDYLTTPGGSTITSSTGYRYFQYRTIESSSDTGVSASLVSASINYTLNTAPATPTLDSPPDTTAGVGLSPQLQTTTTDPDGDYIRYKIELCTDASMTQNCQTFDQTVSQTGWSGQNTQSGTAYTSGTQATYTIQTPLIGATTYYWRSYAIDPAGSNTFGTTQGTPFSFTTNEPPTAPTALLTNGQTNPTGLAPGSVPFFSALHHDPEADNANQYQIQVSTGPTFSAVTNWDSGFQSMTSTADGVRSPNITYAGATLNPNTTFYWRIRFKDVNGNPGAWSTETATFTTTQLFPPPCTLVKASDNESITVQWTDNNTVEDGYTIEKDTDSGGFTSLTTTAANASSYLDTDVTSGHTYTYRIRSFATVGSQTSEWCTSATLSVQISTQSNSGLQFY